MLWKSCNIIHLVIKTDCLKASECIQGIFQITCVVVRAGICSLFCLQLFIYNMYITSDIRKIFRSIISMDIHRLLGKALP